MKKAQEQKSKKQKTYWVMYDVHVITRPGYFSSTLVLWEIKKKKKREKGNLQGGGRDFLESLLRAAGGRGGEGRSGSGSGERMNYELRIVRTGAALAVAWLSRTNTWLFCCVSCVRQGQRQRSSRHLTSVCTAQL